MVDNLLGIFEHVFQRTKAHMILMLHSYTETLENKGRKTGTEQRGKWEKQHG